MDRRYSIVAATMALTAAGCAAPGPPFIDQVQPEAVSMAVRRAQSDVNCPAATGQVISRETAQPLSVYAGVPRAEYTVAVTGCGKNANYIVICPNDGSGKCYAGATRAEIPY